MSRLTDLMSDPSRAWSRYEPTKDEPWDLARVAHLHRRAGFQAPWAALERDLTDGPEAAIDRLMNGLPETVEGHKAAAFEAEHDTMAARAAAGDGVDRLRSVWLHRLLLTPHPLRERMTIFWHNHFATSDAKVKNASLMRKQNELIRSHALGDFKELLAAMGRDPAMLLWLDSAANRKAHPNENYAREVMELFALGRGAYTEKDIQEAARAFTGDFVQGDRFRHLPAQHDPGPKTVLGHTGAFHGDDLPPILLAQPACAGFLARKLVRHFLTEVDEPPDAFIESLAQAIRDADYQMNAPVRMILSSRVFHSDAARRRRVKSPVELTVGTVRALEIVAPTVSSDAMGEVTVAMGQALFAPPGVAGWEGGPSWINTTTTLARTNFALAILGENDDRLGGRLDPEALASKHDRSSEPASFFADLLLQDALDDDIRGRIKGTARDAARLVLTAPEYQLA
jgi:uncharacterized protein (DUF1800 family)